MTILSNPSQFNLRKEIFRSIFTENFKKFFSLNPLLSLECFDKGSK